MGLNLHVRIIEAANCLIRNLKFSGFLILKLMSSFKKYGTLLFLLISFFFFSCQGSVDETKLVEFSDTIAVPSIDLSKALGGNLSDFIEEVKVLQLDTSLNALIPLPSEVIFDDKAVYILDIHKSKSVYSFDLNGVLRFKISRYGRGPGEYTFLTNMAVYGDSLVCWAADKNRLMFFDKYSGELMSEQSGLEKYLLRGFGYTAGGDLIISNDQKGYPDKPNSLYVLNPDLSVKHVLEDSSKLSSAFITSSLPLSRSWENPALYKNVLQDTIYEITSEKTEPKYRVIIPESMKLSEKDLLLSDDGLFKKMVNENLFSMSYSTLNTASYVSIGLIKGRDFKQGMLFSKKSKATLNYSKLNNDLFEFDLPVPVASYKDYMVFVIEPEEVEELESVYKEGAEKFIAPNSSLTIRGNLGLLFIKFKF